MAARDGHHVGGFLRPVPRRRLQDARVQPLLSASHPGAGARRAEHRLQAREAQEQRGRHRAPRHPVDLRVDPVTVPPPRLAGHRGGIPKGQGGR